jgi:hypothetical protein
MSLNSHSQVTRKSGLESRSQDPKALFLSVVTLHLVLKIAVCQNCSSTQSLCGFWVDQGSDLVFLLKDLFS